MSSSHASALQRRETLEARQSAAREVLANSVVMGPSQLAEGVFSFGLPSSCAHYLDIALSEKADEIRSWASKNGKTVTSTTVLDKHPETFRLDAPHPMATPEGFVAVVLPVSGKAVDVEVKGDGTEAEQLTWDPESALFVDTGKAFSLVEGSSHFVYVLVGAEAAKQ